MPAGFRASLHQVWRRLGYIWFVFLSHVIRVSLTFGVVNANEGHTHNAQLIKPIAYNITDPAGFNNPTAPMYSAFAHISLPRSPPLIAFPTVLFVSVTRHSCPRGRWAF